MRYKTNNTNIKEMIVVGLQTNKLIHVKRCPLFATRLVQQKDGSWVCPSCGYYEPLMVTAA